MRFAASTYIYNDYRGLMLLLSPFFLRIYELARSARNVEIQNALDLNNSFGA